MKITKFAHACFIAEQDGQSLIVDPGGWTTDLKIPANVIAVIITHEHPDHLDKHRLQAIVQTNPDVIIVAHESITTQLDGFKSMAVVANEGIKIGNFELELFGGEHAVIADDMTTIANLGVLINEKVYYPGDSFAIPEGHDIDLLALPVSAPWMKYSEAVAFVEAVKPKRVFPTHDAILSQAGKDLIDSMVTLAAKKVGATYHRIDSMPTEA